MGRKSRFTQEQIIRALQEVDAGAKPEEVCRRLGVSDTTFYRWKSKYGGMDVSEAKRPSGVVSGAIQGLLAYVVLAVLAVWLERARSAPGVIGLRDTT